EPIISRAMADRPEDRFATADEMMRALLDVRLPASSMAVAEWVRTTGVEFLDRRQKCLAANEESWRRTSLYTPSSGTQRAAESPMSGSPSPMITSAAPPAESGAFRLEAGASPGS